MKLFGIVVHILYILCSSLNLGSLPTELVKLVNCQIGWKFAVSRLELISYCCHRFVQFRCVWEICFHLQIFTPPLLVLYCCWRDVGKQIQTENHTWIFSFFNEAGADVTALAAVELVCVCVSHVDAHIALCAESSLAVSARFTNVQRPWLIEIWGRRP